MSPSEFDISRDYNRTLAWPMRSLHAIGGLIRLVFGPWLRWLNHPTRRWWTIPLLLGIIVVPVLLPLDGPLSRFAAQHRPRGDLNRELEAIQQFGQGVSLVVIMTAIALLDPSKRRRLFDLALASAFTGLIVLFLKMALGRPRPRPEFNDPLWFSGPLGQYPVSEKAGVRHAWEFWGGISSDLWSMPSSHTAYAVVTAIFLSRMYPRLRPLVATLAGIVGLARVWLGAHYPTDVLVGMLAALSIAPRAIDREWGQLIVSRLATLRSRTNLRPSAVSEPGAGTVGYAEAGSRGALAPPVVSSQRSSTTSASEPETERPSV